MNNRIVMLNNIPSPYCVDLFHDLQSRYTEYEFYFIFTNTNEDNRNWNLKEGILDNVTFLHSKVLKLKTKLDYRYIHFPANINKELDRIDPAIVIAKEYNPSALQSLSWCKKNHRKYIHVTEGTLNSEKHLNLIQKYSRKHIILNSDYCLGSSTKSKEKLLFWGAEEQNIDIAYLTFDLSVYKDIKSEPINGTILYVGSMVERKGLDLLIRALPYIPSLKQLRIVGNGSQQEKRALIQIANDLNVQDRIVWAGYKTGNDLLYEYSYASVFVLPTREDCFGLVLLEAMAAKLPIVSSCYADGAYDIVSPGNNGEITDPYNSKKFGETIEAVMNDAHYAEGAKQADISKFELSAVSDVYYKAIQSVLKYKE